MLTSNQPRTLASIYEPEPPPDKPATTAAVPMPASAPAPSLPAIPEEMKKSSAIYLQGKLGVWTLGDATKELGQYIGYRPGIPSTSVDIFAFDDPTKQFRKIELSFAKTNLKLAGIYAYPWKLTWDECKQLWGSKVKTLKNPDGSKFYEYKDRRLNVLVDKRGDVYNIGLY